jgi:hypothetical protein
MTNAEAIAIIRKEYLCVDRDCDIERNCGRCDLMIPSKEPILEAYKMAIQALEQTQWIPVSERLPEDLKPVNITWVNHEPEPYYHDIKDKNFVATGIHYRGRWYWYSTTCADYLGEYGSNDIDKVDDAVEIVAWMPLPESYKGE